jgi:hypothetical protein
VDGISSNHDAIAYTQRIREFSHYNAARLFLEGEKILEFDPKRAEELFTTVVQMEPGNPYGWAYLLFAREDNGSPMSKLLITCNKFVEAAGKKPIHGLNGISKDMMVEYLLKAEKMGLKIR